MYAIRSYYVQRGNDHLGAKRCELVVQRAGVIGVGVKQSCSDLLVTNCDEFIFV